MFCLAQDPDGARRRLGDAGDSPETRRMDQHTYMTSGVKGQYDILYRELQRATLLRIRLSLGGICSSVASVLSN